MNVQSNAIAERRELPPIAKLNQQLDQRADEFKKALPAHITPEKLQRTIMTAAQNNPDLLAADRQSLITAAMKAAQDGLLPDGREAAFVIFSNRVKDGNNWATVKVVQYMPMVYGLRKKILQSGEISSLQVGVVYRAEVEAGRFIYEEGTEAYLRHKPMLEISDDELSDDNIVAAYSIAKMKDGAISWEVMRRSEINKVRECSQTGAVGRVVKFGENKGKAIEPKGPWVEWFPEQAKKTVMRRHSKTLPMSGDILVDVEGREIEIAARAARVLDAVDPAAPVALPSSEELDERVDSETGEVTGETNAEAEPAKDPATGMTAVDEKTARELDSRGDDDAGEEERDGDTGEPDAKEQFLIDVRSRVEAANSTAALKKVDGDWTKNRAGYDDAVASEVDGLFAAKRRALSEAKEG